MLSRLAATRNRCRTTSSSSSVTSSPRTSSTGTLWKLARCGERRFDVESRLGAAGGRVELDAVAGGEEHGLGLGMTDAPGGQGVGRLRRAERQPLADRQAAVPVVATDHRKFDRAYSMDVRGRPDSDFPTTRVPSLTNVEQRATRDHHETRTTRA